MATLLEASRSRSMSWESLPVRRKKKVTFAHKKSMDLQLTAPLKGCLKFTPSFDTSDRIKCENPVERKRMVSVLMKPTQITQYIRGKAPTSSYLWTSSEGNELYISEAKNFSRYTVVHLSDVQYLVMGPRTDNFAGYDWFGKSPELCFSIVLPNCRTLDFECSSKQHFLDMYLGIQYFIPLSHRNFNRAKVNWYRGIIRSLLKSIETGKNITEIWDTLVQEARTDLCKRTSGQLQQIKQ